MLPIYPSQTAGVIDLTAAVRHGLTSALNAAGAEVGLPPLDWDLTQPRHGRPTLTGAVRPVHSGIATRAVVNGWAAALNLPEVADDHGEIEATGHQHGWQIVIWGLTDPAVVDVL